ncbi:MAG: hypothetical protein NC098_00200 [Lachnoclostridium sp.]|nr:hypothetical protein [Lachnoclostridium sp.]
MRRYLPFILFAVIAFTFLPWLGDTLFNTKGEPREAIVAVSMIQSGNYILPESCGGDIPYKPPFLAWLIVACSWLTGGVNEYASRLPSALATIGMLIGVYLFVRRRALNEKFPDLLAALATAVTATTIEVFRAATACRVDMVLTACIVGAILFINRRREKDGKPTMSTWGTILMTCAVLTKGPVGMILPCLICWIYFMLRGDKLWRTTWTVGLAGLTSLAGYLLWLNVAYIIGGKPVIDLVLEENFGRMLGTMSYESHVNPWYYNIITVIAGMLPYTLPAIFALFVVKIKTPYWGHIRNDLKTMAPPNLLSLVAIVVTLVFYTIPASKRSVYLLPLYPFLSYLVARMLIWLAMIRSKAITVYGSIIGGLALLVPIVTVVATSVDFTKIIHGLTPELEAMISGLYDHGISYVGWICLAASVGAAYMVFASIKKLRKAYTLIWTVAATFTIYWCLSSTILPGVLNSKSDIRYANVLSRYAAPDEIIYSYVDTPMLRYYTAGYYLGDRVVPIQGRSPRGGYLLVGEKDLTKFMKRYGDAYDYSVIYRSSTKSCDTRQKTLILRIDHK